MDTNTQPYIANLDNANTPILQTYYEQVARIKLKQATYDKFRQRL